MEIETEVSGEVITTFSEETDNAAAVTGAVKVAPVGCLASTGTRVVVEVELFATAPISAMKAARADVVEVPPATRPTSATIATMCGTTYVDEADEPSATAPTVHAET